MSDVKVWISIDAKGTMTLRPAHAKPTLHKVPASINDMWHGLDLQPGECRCYRLVPVDNEEES
jgi:hypothetical protein